MASPTPQKSGLTGVQWLICIVAGRPSTVDPRDPRTRELGHIEPANMDERLARLERALGARVGESLEFDLDDDFEAISDDESLQRRTPEELRAIGGAHPDAHELALT